MSTTPTSLSPQKEDIHEHIEDRGHGTLRDYTRNINAKYVYHNQHYARHRMSYTVCRIINPLNGIPKSELFGQVSRFCADNGLQDKEKTFQKGALVAQSPAGFEDIPDLDEDDRYHLRREITRMSRTTYNSCAACSLIWTGHRPLASAQGLILYHRSLFPRLRHTVGDNYIVLIHNVLIYFRGWDNTGANGANLSFPEEFGITDNTWLVGFINSA